MSNKTLKADDAKTKLAHNGQQIIIFSVLIISIILSSWYVLTHKETNNTINIGNNLYRVEYARTEAEQTKGLGMRDSIEADQVMQFIFDSPGGRCFWMKDMRFAIDIVFVDEDGRVVKVINNASPDSYPGLFCANSVKNVIEMKAGQAKEAGLSVGNRLKL